jgi:WD40 repeat protein
MTNNHRYTAFISYRHTEPDMTIAKNLAKQIETYTIPKSIKVKTNRKTMGKVFRDQDELPTSSNLGADIEQALKDSPWLIVICSENLPKSKWCMKEIDTFIALGKRDHILTVLIQGEPEESFPPQLRFIEENGMIREIEPLAADIRADSLKNMLKKLRSEKLRIIAPMLQVGYDDLRQRAFERRLKRIATVSLTAVILLSAFLFYAITQNQRILQQRNQALNNEMLLLIEKANTATSNNDKLLALQQALQAYDISKSLPVKNEQSLIQALESASYFHDFEEVAQIKNSNMHITDLTYSPDGQTVLGVINNNSAVIIDTQSTTIRFTVNNNREALSHIAFSDQGKYFLTLCAWENTVSIWTSDDGTKLGEYTLTDAYSYSLASAHFINETPLVLLKEQTRLILWDVIKDTKTEFLNDFLENQVSIYKEGQVSPDGKYMAIGTDFSLEIVLVSIENQQRIPMEQTNDKIIDKVIFSNNSQMIAGQSGTYVTIWDIETRKIIQEIKHDTDIYQAIFNPENNAIALTSTEGIALYQLSNGQQIWRIGENNQNQLYKAIFSPDGQYLLAHNVKLALHDAQTGMKITGFDKDDINDVNFSPDDRYIILSENDGTVSIIASPNQSTIQTEPSYSNDIYMTPRNTPLVKSDFIARTQHFVPPQYPAHHTRMISSPDGTIMAISLPDGFVEIYEIEKSEYATHAIAEHIGQVTDMAFNKMIFASSGFDGRVVIYDMEKRGIRYVIPFDKPIDLIDFSKDGLRLIILCSSNQSAYVYSTLSGARLFTITSPDVPFVNIGFTQDNRYAVALLNDGSAKTGKIFLSLEELLENAENRLNR